jgi:formylglycine-generating enzyme required for sulfatase activity
MNKAALVSLAAWVLGCTETIGASFEDRPNVGDDGPRDASPTPDRATTDQGFSDADAPRDAPTDRSDASEVALYTQLITRRRPSCPDPAERGCGSVRVRGGTFTLGGGEPALSRPAQPGITVGGFVLDQDEVTVRRFRVFYQAGMPMAPWTVRYPGGALSLLNRPLVREPLVGALPLPNNALVSTWTPEPSDYDRRSYPVVSLTWTTAQSFCVWDGGRLPTESEWEWVALHIPDGRPVPRRYSFGNGPASCSAAVFNPPEDVPCAFRHVKSGNVPLAPVGTVAPEGFFHDLGGNAAEWVADRVNTFEGDACWNSTPRTDPVCDTPSRYYASSDLVRGGHIFSREPTTLGSRSWPQGGPYGVGFRCAYDE